MCPEDSTIKRFVGVGPMNLFDIAIVNHGHVKSKYEFHQSFAVYHI